MIKKLFLGLLVVAATWIVAPQAFAEEETSTSSSIEMRERIDTQRSQLEARREEIRFEAEARRQAAQDALEARKAEWGAKRDEYASSSAQREVQRSEMSERRVENAATRAEKQLANAERQAQNAFRVILATIERLEKIAGRIESRMEKIAAVGGATSEAVTHIANAKTHLEMAKVSANTLLSIDLSGEKSQDNFQMVRSAAREARDHIRAAHEDLMLAVRSLKASQPEVESATEADVEEEDN